MYLNQSIIEHGLYFNTKKDKSPSPTKSWATVYSRVEINSGNLKIYTALILNWRLCMGGGPNNVKLVCSN